MRYTAIKMAALLGAAMVWLAPALRVQALQAADGAGGNVEHAQAEGSEAGNVKIDADVSGENFTNSGETVEIYTYEDLLRMAENPSGNYLLKNSIDMEGKIWNPIDFSGVFDGGGHSLLNLSVTGLSDGVEDTYDGNYKVYPTRFGGLFGTIKDAEIRELDLVNVRVRVETDEPCFIGSIAGYSKDSRIRDCHISGCLELSAHDRMFGVGGIVGYGSGQIEMTDAEVTLVCTDTDAATKDEQFMGGAYAAGYIDLEGCNIAIDGYDSDHGYVHDGGLVGMYILYPLGLKYEGNITNNFVKGTITFFEDNKNRRAYCSEYVGEIMNWTFVNRGNQAEFVRNEVFDYSVDLKPNLCEDNEYTEEVTEPGCDTFGYTTVTCGNCGYAYRNHYTLYRHSVADWKVTREPTVEETGIQMGSCTLCGSVLEEEIEKLDPAEAAAMAAAAEESADEKEPGEIVGKETDEGAVAGDGAEGENVQANVGRNAGIAVLLFVAVLFLFLLAVGKRVLSRKKS